MMFGAARRPVPADRDRVAGADAGRTDEAYEREADAVAERVVTARDPVRPVPPAGHPAIRATTAAGMLRSPGAPLDPGTRAFMEPRFGLDFSAVRVHAGAAAARSADSLNAYAYTVGNHIVLGGGAPSPSTPEARRLLAHELTHVVRQAPAGGPPTATPRVQRQAKPGSVRDEPGTIVYFTGGTEAFIAELERRGFIAHDEWDAWGWIGDGIYLGKSSGSGAAYRHFRVLDAHYVRDEKGDIIGYRVVSWLRHGTTGPAAGDKAAESKPPAKPAPADKKPAADPAEQRRSQFEALPQVIKDLLRPGQSIIKPEDMPQVLRIARKLSALTPDELRLYQLLADRLAVDLDAFEKSVDAFIKFKTQLAAQTAAESGQKEPTLEQKLEKTWAQLDEKKFGGMTTRQKEDLARKIAAEQRDIQLEHMLHHPGQTAADMAKGVVRVDKTAKAIVDDVKEMADSGKSAAARAAGGLGAYNKAMTAVASIVFIALLFVPGVNLVELAVAGLAVTAAAIALSSAEAELRIQAAGESTTVEDYKTETGKSAAAQVSAVTSAAMLVVTLALKIIARIPLPGRFQNVGAAFKAAQTGLLNKTGIGPAWVTVKTQLIARLKAAKQGLPEALAAETKQAASTATAVQGMTGDEFLQHLADGDPKLADLSIPAEQAKATQQLARTSAGKNVAEQLRKDSLTALQDAPGEAQKRVDQFVKEVDDAVGKVEKAETAEQLKAAVDDAAKPLDPEAQAQQASADAKAYVQKRVGAALREQTEAKLVEVQKGRVATQATVERLESELHAAENEVKRLGKEAAAAERGSTQRADLVRKVDEAKAKLAQIREEDELGGYRADRTKLAAQEAALLESLGLKRPGLWQATKDAVRRVAKRNAQREFLDANTGEVIKGEPVFGHKYGFEHRRLVLKATKLGMNQERFIRWVNEHPEWFQLETEANNSSHRFEKPGIAGYDDIQ